MQFQTNLKHFTIRKAIEGDVALILSFIRELAEYERMLDEVIATEDDLRASLFGERQVSEVIIGEWQNDPVAFALYFHNYSTFLGRPGLYLEDLYVKPEMRGVGIGKVILSYLAYLAKKRGCGRLEWWVLDWNEPAVKFYRSIGAVPMDEWTVQRMTGKALERLAAQFEQVKSG